MNVGPATQVTRSYVEFRNLTNGKRLPCGAGLLGALTFFGFDAMGAMHKEAMRNLAQRGGPYTDVEKKAIGQLTVRKMS